MGAACGSAAVMVDALKISAKTGSLAPPVILASDVPRDATAIIPYRQHWDQKMPCTTAPRMRSSQAPCPSCSRANPPS